MLDFILVRVIFVAIFGFAAAYFRPENVAFWAAAFYGAAGAVLAIFMERRFSRASLKRTIGITIGVVSGLFCSALVSVVLSHIGNENSSALRFIQRYDKRPMVQSRKDVTRTEIYYARKKLEYMYENSTPFDYNHYIYKDYILIVKHDTIITLLNKMF